MTEWTADEGMTPLPDDVPPVDQPEPDDGDEYEDDPEMEADE